MSDLGLPFSVRSEDGIEYRLDVFRGTGAGIRQLWEQVGKHRVLFCDQAHGDYEAFVKMILKVDTVVLSVGNVGIVYATDLIPGYSAKAHFFFWDRTSAGRHRVILSALRWGIDSFGLHRFDMEVPRHAYSALHRIHKIGFRIEGIKKEAQLFKGKWHDVLQFGVLASELTDRALETGQLERVEAERRWFGYLSKDTALMNHIMRLDERERERSR